MSTAPPSYDREIVNTRLIPATSELIFTAMSDPGCLARWWGPKGFRNTFHEFDFKPGGNWRYDMHGPDGTDYPNRSVIEEVTPHRVVIRHLEPMHEFFLTITLVPEGEGTLLTWSMVFESAEECDRVRPFIPQCNEENLDRLESELGRLARGA